MRWDRVGRIGLLVVLAVVVGLYVQHAMTYVSTRQEAHRDAAVVQRLTRDNAALMSTQRSLQDPATIEKTARALGMIKPGERPYVITGLPKK
jgi:cell division protein FtsB